MAKKISNLKISEKAVKKGNLELKIGAGAGALTGATVAGYINTAFPNLIQTVGGAIIGGSTLNWKEKAAALATLASAPVDWIAPVVITGIGIGIGVLVGQGVKLIRNKNHKKKEEGKKR